MSQVKPQTGSVAIYVVGAVVLLALLSGAFYLAKQRAQNSDQSQPVAVGPGEEKQAPIDNSNDTTKKDTDSSNQEQAESSNSNSAARQGGDEATNDQPNNSSAARDSDQATGEVTDDKQVANTGPQTVANTGPSDHNGSIASAGPSQVIATLVGLMALAASLSAYLKSHRHLHSVK